MPNPPTDDDSPSEDLLDELGDWSQIKHEILEKYAHAYTTVLSRQPLIRRSLYIDAYAGCGFGADRDTGEKLKGSAIRAMNVQPPFDELHFIEADAAKSSALEKTTAHDPRVTVHRGDGVSTLSRDLLQRCRYADYHRALCLLDPYDLSVPWSLIERLGRERSIEIFYNFMIMDANRNVLWKRPERVSAERVSRMDLVWGDRSWQEELYETEYTLFGDERRKVPNRQVAEAFRTRLKSVAGFKYVPEPIAMKNSLGATVYYLFFASHNETGAKIVADILKPYVR